MEGLHSGEGFSVASKEMAGGTNGAKRKNSFFGARTRVLTGLALVGSLVTYGLAIPATTATASTTSVRITLGGGTDFTDAVIYYADQLLGQEGISVQLNNLADPASALQSVVAGSSDIYLGDPMETAVAVGNGGANVKYIATLAQTTDYVVLALPNYNLSNLSGATMGSAGAGTAGTIIANAALKKLGIDPTSIHDVTVGGTSARITAILSGQIDLAPALAASAVPAVETGKVKILFNAGTVMGAYLQQGLTASDNFLKYYPKVAQEVVNAYVAANRWAQTNEAAFIQFADSSKLQGSLTAAQQQESWTQLQTSKFFAVDGAVAKTDINPTEAYTWAAGGSLTQANTPAYSTWVDPSFVNKYLLVNGTFNDHAVVSRISGSAVRGKSVKLQAQGKALYGTPKVTSDAPGTSVRVTKTTTSALNLQVTTSAGTAKGVHSLTFHFAQGQVVKVHYSVA